MNELSICLRGQVKEGRVWSRLLQVLSDQVWEDSFVVGTVLKAGKIVTSCDDFLPRPLTSCLALHSTPLLCVGLEIAMRHPHEDVRLWEAQTWNQKRTKVG